jgi:hypothetical protein
MQKLSSLCAVGDYEGVSRLLEEQGTRVNSRDSFHKVHALAAHVTAKGQWSNHALTKNDF